MNIRLQVPRMWWLAAPALVLALLLWCQLHARALGVAPIGLEVSAPWAFKTAAGWILAGGLLAASGNRLRNWTARAAAVAAIVTITMSCELLLAPEEGSLALRAYERLPLHITFAALLVAGYLLIQARHAPTTLPEIPGDASGESPRTVEVLTGTGRTRVQIDEIECLEADRNYINVHTPQRTYLLRQTLASLEKSLQSETFLRIHRSMIVNRNKIRERRRGGVLVLSSGRTVRVSRAFADRLS
ncbi:MAG TPA: LytTR family DNA-binding domain-containing protein [Steroidobacteraceae bacterium]|nr:LytTR family DNA-binding domain-containing protein [Steroidobacteraceae bacterium]